MFSSAAPSTMSAGFAVLATLLAAVGLYGVLAYTVAQRTREIGLRMALGAAPNRVRAMVLRQVAVMTLIGGAVGLVGAVWAGRAAKSILYQMEGHDPLVLAGSVVLLTLVALGAGFIPAIMDPSLLDGIIQVDPADAKDMARRSALEEGVLVGISSGATLAAIRQKLPELGDRPRVLGFNYDTGERYLSVPDFLPEEVS